MIEGKGKETIHTDKLSKIDNFEDYFWNQDLSMQWTDRQACSLNYVKETLLTELTLDHSLSFHTFISSIQYLCWDTNHHRYDSRNSFHSQTIPLTNTGPQ